jgi:hypothetical protein
MKIFQNLNNFCRREDNCQKTEVKTVQIQCKQHFQILVI